MRTKEMSGISLLGLQDFPGQGTALVGMMNSHLEPKPFEFAKPEHFKSFFRESLPLVLLKKYTYETTEKLTAAVVIANFGRADIAGEASYELRRIAMDDRGYSLTGMPKEGEQIAKGELPYAVCPAGELTEAGRLEIELGSLALEENARLNLVVRLGELVNVYPLWVYMPVEPVCPENVYETGWLDERAKAVLEEGGRVYLTPPAVKEAMTSSIKTQFTTDFWSVGTFPGQEGAMGQLIDTKHPIFREFPTEFHTNWQWWPMASQRAFILPKKYKAIVTEMDSYAFMRPMAQLLECRVGKGRLMLSSMDLGHLRQYPEARALQAAIYRYMASEEFALGQDVPEISVEELEGEIGIRRVNHEE
jgi:hypothetical protein